MVEGLENSAAAEKRKCEELPTQPVKRAKTMAEVRAQLAQKKMLAAKEAETEPTREQRLSSARELLKKFGAQPVEPQAAHGSATELLKKFGAQPVGEVTQDASSSCAKVDSGVDVAVVPGSYASCSNFDSEEEGLKKNLEQNFRVLSEMRGKILY